MNSQLRLKRKIEELLSCGKLRAHETLFNAVVGNIEKAGFAAGAMDRCGCFAVGARIGLKCAVEINNWDRCWRCRRRVDDYDMLLSTAARAQQ
jgi:hypothetical protein